MAAKNQGLLKVLTSREVGMDLIKEVGMFIAVMLALFLAGSAVRWVYDYWS